MIGRRLAAETTFRFMVVTLSMLMEESVNSEVSIYPETAKRKSLDLAARHYSLCNADDAFLGQ